MNEILSVINGILSIVLLGVVVFDYFATRSLVKRIMKDIDDLNKVLEIWERRLK